MAKEIVRQKSIWAMQGLILMAFIQVCSLKEKNIGQKYKNVQFAKWEMSINKLNIEVKMFAEKRL